MNFGFSPWMEKISNPGLPNVGDEFLGGEKAWGSLLGRRSCGEVAGDAPAAVGCERRKGEEEKKGGSRGLPVYIESGSRGHVRSKTRTCPVSRTCPLPHRTCPLALADLSGLGSGLVR